MPCTSMHHFVTRANHWKKSIGWLLCYSHPAFSTSHPFWSPPESWPKDWDLQPFLQDRDRAPLPDDSTEGFLWHLVTMMIIRCTSLYLKLSMCRACPHFVQHPIATASASAASLRRPWPRSASTSFRLVARALAAAAAADRLGGGSSLSKRRR